MVNRSEVERQLRHIGYNFHFWWRAERRELGNILMPDEKIAHCINGQYAGGFAILCVTDHRILLIDRKPMYLTLEDIRFDMLAEIDYQHRMLNASIHLTTPNRTLVFASWNHAQMRNLMNYAQRRLIELRQLYMHQQFQPFVPFDASTALGQGAVANALSPGTFAYAAGSNTGRLAVPFQAPNNLYTQVPLLSRHRITKYSR